MLVVSHNIMEMNAERQFNIVTRNKAKSNEKLASGYRINRAADDAAGLSISEKMRNQIRGLNQALKNIDDGISVIQVADGALSETHNILHRIEELAVKASNDTNTSEDRKMIDDEIQQLKQEMKRIFYDTEFNGKKIFAMPYVPEIEGTPNDMQVFNIGDGEYGGVTINNIRYTWSELGIELQADGSFYEGKYEFDTWDNEHVCLETKKGSRPPEISRKYEWHAETDGIYINNKLASTWDDMQLDSTNTEAGNYSFEYHGVTISFDVPKGDNIEDVINGINANTFGSYVTWNSVYSATESSKGVDITDFKKDLVITDSRKQYVEDLIVPFRLIADDEGVTIEDSKGGPHTKMKWEELMDASISSADTNGGYPIVDWGVTDGGREQTDITLDDSAVYTYVDDVTGFSYSFQLKDELSLDAIKEGLSVPMRTYITAPTQTNIQPADVTETRFSLSENYTSISYALQYDTGKSFDNWNSTMFNTTYNATVDAVSGDYVFEYNLQDTGFNTLKTISATLKRSDLQELAKRGGKAELLFTDGQGNSDMKMSLMFQVDKFSEPIPDDIGIYNDKYAELKENARQNYIASNGNDTGFEASITQDMESAWDTAAQTAVNDTWTNYNAKLDLYTDEAFQYLSDVVLSTEQTEPPAQHVNVDENYVINRHTNFDVILNPPEKYMNIQSGANRGDVTRVDWKGLNLAVIGMGGVHTTDFSGAQGTINATQRAVKIISAERSKFGAQQNRLCNCYNNNANYSENLQRAESQIRDTDMAEEMLNYSKHSILEQAGQAMLAQANQQHQRVLSLLQ